MSGYGVTGSCILPLTAFCCCMRPEKIIFINQPECLMTKRRRRAACDAIGQVEILSPTSVARAATVAQFQNRTLSPLFIDPFNTRWLFL